MTGDRLTTEREQVIALLQRVPFDSDPERLLEMARRRGVAIAELRAELSELRADRDEAVAEIHRLERQFDGWQEWKAKAEADLVQTEAMRLATEAECARLREALEQEQAKVAATFGRNHVLLLTPEQLQWLAQWLGGFPVGDDTANWINAEVHRALRYDTRSLAAGGREQECPRCHSRLAAGLEWDQSCAFGDECPNKAGGREAGDLAPRCVPGWTRKEDRWIYKYLSRFSF